MNAKKENHVKLSRFLSLLLRHKPETLNLYVDNNGYVDVNELIEKVNTTKYSIDKNILDGIVLSDNKKRYSYNSTETKIRANQGHSIMVDLELTECAPPEKLYHGTSTANARIIRLKGILKQSRHHVHLSESFQTALDVGSRRSEPVVLEIDAMKMSTDGYKFYLSENGVWLTDKVPVDYIYKY